jgi:hypothetical protein
MERAQTDTDRLNVQRNVILGLLLALAATVWRSQAAQTMRLRMAGPHHQPPLQVSPPSSAADPVRCRGLLRHMPLGHLDQPAQLVSREIIERIFLRRGAAQLAAPCPYKSPQASRGRRPQKPSGILAASRASASHIACWRATVSLFSDPFFLPPVLRPKAIYLLLLQRDIRSVSTIWGHSAELPANLQPDHPPRLTIPRSARAAVARLRFRADLQDATRGTAMPISTKLYDCYDRSGSTTNLCLIVLLDQAEEPNWRWKPLEPALAQRNPICVAVRTSCRDIVRRHNCFGLGGLADPCRPLHG